MEIYELLYTVPAREVEVGDLISFAFLDEDEDYYTETVHVSDVDYDGEYVFVTGFSEVLNENDEFHLHESTDVGVLGG